MVMPNTRASAGAAGAALGALEVMMASIHRAAILNTSPHQTFLGYWRSTAVIVLGSCKCVQDTKRRPAIVYRGKQGRLCSSTLKPGHGAARFGGEADFELRGWIGCPRARHVIDAVAYLLVTGAIAIV